MAPKVPVQMYDSVNGLVIPTTAEVVMGYIDGDYKWTDAMWQQHDAAEKVTVTVFGDIRANVADVEHGNMTPDDAAVWIHDKQAAEHKGATVYCNLSTRPAVEEACHGLAYYLALADPTGVAHDLPGTVFVQWHFGQHYDVSQVSDQEWLDLINEVNRPWPW